jgi:hypothetical protein
MLYRIPTPLDANPPASRPVTGRFLAHNGLSAPRRAFLGVDVLTGKVQPTKLTKKQVAALVGVSVPYLVAALRVAFARPDLRGSCACGLVPLLTAVPRSGRAERLASMWATASADERHTFIKMVGVDSMFDTTIEAA